VVERVEVDGHDAGVRRPAGHLDDLVGIHHERLAAGEAGAARGDDDHVRAVLVGTCSTAS
jgi:hypothetical protein